MTIFTSSDHHFFHRNLIADGKIAIRGQFDSMDAMHEHIVERHNSVVRPNDKVYFLGDVCLDQPKKNAVDPDSWPRFVPLKTLITRMHGQKRLILGNHDHLPWMWYYELGFEKVLAMRKLAGDVLFTHVPVHPSQFYRWRGNVHGHTHEHNVQHEEPLTTPDYDTRYINVSLENINYTPISLEDILQRLPENR